MSEKHGSARTDLGATASMGPARVTADELRRIRHDARSAVGQILGYAELLAEEAVERGQEGFVPDLERIAAASRRLLGLLDALSKGGAAPPAPAERAPARPPCEVAGEGLLPADGVAPASLLVVDDNETNRDLLARRLGRMGHLVATAASGPEALETIEARPFHLVLLDVTMPGMSGLEVLAKLRETRSQADLPVVMATARDSSEDVVAALELGANDYVTKPLDMPVVQARIKCQLALKRARDEVKLLNRSLEAAQEEITRLAESATEALEDVEAWSSAAARDIARSLGVEEVGVWIRDGAELTGVTRSRAVAPSAVELAELARSGQCVDRPGDTVVPVLGLSGELYGALVVPARRQALDATAMRLLGGFARQLGGALELRRTRQELEEAAARQRRRREEMIDRGIDVLKLCPRCQRCYDQTTASCEDDQSALEAPPAFPYRVANRYRLVRQLGEGGMGTVFSAEDERLGRRVALKVVKAEHFHDATVRSRFEREARAVARIDHPGVIEVHDCGELEDGSLFIVMERLRGWDLGAIVKACGPGRPDQVARLLRLGGSALDAAHAAGILHRDVKPENIFVVGDLDEFTVKILDFGVAKEVKAETRLTQTGCLVGTPLFMSPEQILCQALDSRTDLFSFAAVGFLALTGRRVTLEDKFIDVLLDLVHNVPPPVSTVLAGAPPELDAAFGWALDKDPSARPGSCAEWLAGFVELLEAMPASSPGWRASVMEGKEPRWEPAGSVSATAATRVDGS